MSPCQPIKSSDLDKSRMKHGGLLNKHFCKNKNQISAMTWQILSISTFGRLGGLVVERRTPEREVGGSILTRVAVLYP